MGTLLLARLAALLALSAAAQAAPASPEAAASSFTLSEVKPGVFAAIARPGDQDSVGNAGFVVGSEAVLVVDAFAGPRAASELLDRIRRTTPLPVRWLIDTHHHGDHCGGNSVFATTGAVIVAQEAARARMRERLAPADLPTLTYRDTLTIWLGDRRVDVFTKPGHTDGDSLVSVPDADALFGGDLIQKSTVPNLADAKTDAWIRTLDELAPRFPSATLIPGHGAVARPLDMRALRDYLLTLRTAVARQLARGVSGEALRAAIAPALERQFRSWSGAEHIGETVEQMERELRGSAKGAAAPTAVPSPSPRARGR